MKIRIVVGALFASLSLLLSGCAAMTCGPYCGRQEHNSSSLVQFLYPDGSIPATATEVPQLRLPLRVGLAFLPSSGLQPDTGLDAAHKQALLESIRQRFVSRKFVADITVIPDYYLATSNGFTGLEGLQRLHNIDLVALVSYDQIAHADEKKLALGYLTIVGAYVLKGTHHDVSTLVDLAVVHPATRSLVLRAGGVDSQNLNTTLVDANREQRQARAASFDAATAQMIENFDLALLQFETDVREGKANVQVTSRNGGGGSFDGLLLGLLAFIVAIRVLPRRRILSTVVLALPFATAAWSGQPTITGPATIQYQQLTFELPPGEWKQSAHGNVLQFIRASGQRHVGQELSVWQVPVPPQLSAYSIQQHITAFFDAMRNQERIPQERWHGFQEQLQPAGRFVFPAMTFKVSFHDPAIKSSVDGVHVLYFPVDFSSSQAFYCLTWKDFHSSCQATASIGLEPFLGVLASVSPPPLSLPNAAAPVPR